MLSDSVYGRVVFVVILGRSCTVVRCIATFLWQYRLFDGNGFAIFSIVIRSGICEATNLRGAALGVTSSVQ